MDLAILFWFYKEPEICENRLKILKKYNSEIKIYGFFGGVIEESEYYKDKLGSYLDDFYCCDLKKDSGWKWINGDLVLLDWYQKRGFNLAWDGIAVVQWDTLILESLKNQFADIEKDQIFLSGVRELNSDIEGNWRWTTGADRVNFLKFKKNIEDNFQYKDNLLCCPFIFQIFPKIFFEKYILIKDREVGMLEYKIPTYAKIFNIPFFEKDVGAYWENIEKPMNAIPREIDENYIKDHFFKPDGWKIFHPYYHYWNIN